MKKISLLLIVFILSVALFAQSGQSEFKSVNITGDKNVYRGDGDPLKGLNVAKAEEELAFGNYYAFIIGIDEYNGEWPKLSNAVNDARGVQEVLKQKYQFNNFVTLFNAEATRENIIKNFEWLIKNVEEKDNLLIFYSGHGDFKPELNKGYWVPVDARTKSISNYISNSDIQTFLGGVKSKHTLLVSDACFSGDLFRGKTYTVPFEDSDKYYKEVHRKVSRQALTSGGLQPVMDGGRDGHSVFSYYFLKMLESNERKYFDASQLYNDIKIPVVNNSEQTPEFHPIKDTGDEGGQFIFVTE